MFEVQEMRKMKHGHDYVEQMNIRSLGGGQMTHTNGEWNKALFFSGHSIEYGKDDLIDTILLQK